MGTTLVSINITSGVNDDGDGFVIVAAHGDDGTILVGQFTPKQLRELALDYLESAEGADQDAAVLRLIRKLELPDQLAGAIITELRESRDK